MSPTTLPRRHFAGLALAAALMASAAPVAAQPADAFAVTNVRIFDGSKVIAKGTVVVRGGKIVSVGAAKAPAGVRQVDGAGKTLLPGLIDSHVHFVDSYKAQGGTALEQAAAYGITTVMDLATGNPTDYIAFRKEVKAGAYPNGADLFTAGPGATTQQLKEPAQAQAWVDAHKAGGADYIKIFAYAPTDRGGPDAALKPETMAAIITAAHKDRLMVVSHSLNEPISRGLIAAGLDGLVHVNGAGLNAPDFGKLLASHGTFQSTNLISAAPAAYRTDLAAETGLTGYMPQFQIDALKNARDPQQADPFKNQVANIKMIHDAGALTMVGTDGFFPYSPLLHGEMALMVKDAGFAPVEVLRMATANTAKAYKMADRGRIAPGLRADLLLVDGDPTTDIRAAGKIDTVWINGRAVDRAALKTKLTALPAPPPRPPAPAAPPAGAAAAPRPAQ